MRMIALLLLVLAVPQEVDYDKQVAEFVTGLTEEELDARDRATVALTALGPKAVEAIKKRAGQVTDGDVRARLLSIVKEIERRERMKDYLGGVTKVSLKADKMTLKDVVAELRTQARTKILVLGAVKDEVVTVEFSDVPFFEALDRICKAQGNVTYRLSGGSWSPQNSDETVSLVKGVHGKVPRLVKNQFVVDLAMITLIEDSDFGGAAKEEMRLEFRSMWEKGTKPIGAKLNLTALVDDKGVSYLDQVEKQPNQGGGNWQWIPMSYSIGCGKIPGPEVKEFKEIAGELVLDFPSDLEVLKVESPLGKTEVVVSGDSFAFTLVSMVREGKLVKAKVSAGNDASLWNREFKLFDKGGKSYASTFTSSTSDQSKMTVDLQFSAPAEAEITEMRLTIPKPGGAQKIEFKFENVKIR